MGQLLHGHHHDRRDFHRGRHGRHDRGHLGQASAQDDLPKFTAASKLLAYHQHAGRHGAPSGQAG
eukprot:1556197-Prymnesium_polylepis.1